LARAHSASRSVHTLPRVDSEAARTFSCAVRAPSLLSSSLSWAISCSCNSTVVANTTITSEGEDALHNQQAEIGVTTRSKNRQVSGQGRTPPNRWQSLAIGGVRPCSTGQWLVAIMVGAPAPRTLAVVSPTSHHRQWSGVMLKIGGENRRFLSQLARDQNSKASGSSKHTPEIVYDMLGA
jgi:hypothetical protein